MTFLAILTAWFLLVRLEPLKMRYNPDKLVKELQVNTSYPVVISRYSDVGQTLQYLEIGDRSHLPLVVGVHGSPGALNAYKEYYQDETFLEHADFISVDRLGFGYSNFGNSKSSLKIQSSIIASLLSGHSERPIILLGHSMGAPVISRLAMDYPQLADGMIMIAPPISPELEPSNAWRKILDLIPVRWLTPPALRVCNQEIIPLKGELVEMKDRWSTIEIPVTIIHGTKDPLVSYHNAEFARNAMIENQHVEVMLLEGANHFILWSETELIKGQILKMLKNLDKLKKS